MILPSVGRAGSKYLLTYYVKALFKYKTVKEKSNVFTSSQILEKKKRLHTTYLLISTSTITVLLSSSLHSFYDRIQSDCSWDARLYGLAFFFACSSQCMQILRSVYNRDLSLAQLKQI